MIIARFFIGNTLASASVFLNFSQIQPKIFLRCFLKINITSTKIQAIAILLWYFEFYLFVSLLLRPLILLSQESWSWFSLFLKKTYVKYFEPWCFVTLAKVQSYVSYKTTCIMTNESEKYKRLVNKKLGHF